jgi:hypothetical protein
MTNRGKTDQREKQRRLLQSSIKYSFSYTEISEGLTLAFEDTGPEFRVISPLIRQYFILNYTLC